MKSSTQETYTIQADNFIPFEILKSQFNKKRYISIEDLFRNINFHNKIGIPYDEHKVVFLEESASSFIMLYYDFYRTSFFIYQHTFN